MNIKKIATAFAAASLLFQSSLPAFAATTLIISGNGSDSDSEVELEQESTTTVVQSNVTSIVNDIDVDSNTGDNEVEDNTGGEVSVTTGDADADVKVVNSVNTNVVDVDSCGSCLGDVDVLIEGNGTGTENEVDLEIENEVDVFQENVAKINNDIDIDLETGDNKAEDNTGGNVEITTGDSDASVVVLNTANANSAVVAGGEGGDVDLVISGNGSDSDNEIDLELEREVVLTQENRTAIVNDVDVDLETGKNDAEDNTGGDVMLETGAADASVLVDNMAGFNFASVEDCCLDDIFGKIAGNGTDSENEIEAEFETELEVFQDNLCGNRCAPCFDNDVDVDLETGDNEVEDSTSEYDGDPSVETGDTEAEVEVHNSGGSNAYGSEAPDWDDMWEGMDFDFEFSFNLGDLLAALLG